MDYLKELFVELTVSETNFKMLHWTACGKEFDNIHALCSDFYNEVVETLDYVAECIFRLDSRPMTLLNVAGFIQESDSSYYMVEPIDHDKKQVYKSIDIILGEILDKVEAVLGDLEGDIHHIGMKSTFESIHEEYDQKRSYLNKRRLTEVED